MNKSITLQVMLAFLVAVTASDVYGQGRRGGQGKQQRSGAQSGQSQSGRQGNASRQPRQGTGQMGQGQNEKGANNSDKLNANGSLSAKQRQDLLLMREEEKLARDVYLAMKAKWGANVFNNIARAESQHMKAIAGLLSRYGIPDPVTNNTPGSFTAVRFQKLYQTLVAAGSNSLVDAYKVALKIEEMDIADLRSAIQSTTSQDVKRVYENLERASRNHLRAFASQLKKAGGTYIATNLTQAEFDQIATGRQQRGGGQGQTGGKNSGRSNNGQGNAQRKGRGRGGNNRGGGGR